METTLEVLTTTKCGASGSPTLPGEVKAQIAWDSLRRRPCFGFDPRKANRSTSTSRNASRDGRSNPCASGRHTLRYDNSERDLTQPQGAWCVESADPRPNSLVQE
jgi:hypothetical protein